MKSAPIKGYRDLSQAEIDLMNKLKDLAIEVGNWVDIVLDDPATDKRWANIAKTDLQKGFMSLIRAVAQPETF
jgi:hypothetical protein